MGCPWLSALNDWHWRQFNMLPPLVEWIRPRFSGKGFYLRLDPSTPNEGTRFFCQIDARIKKHFGLAAVERREHKGSHLGCVACLAEMLGSHKVSELQDH